MDWAQFDAVQFSIGIAVGLVIVAAAWSIVRRASHREMRELRQNLLAETERRSAAEAKLAEIPKLETLIKSNERAIANFNDERKEQGERIAQLEAELANEQNNAKEKLALLEDAQKKLADAFNALAAKALSSNNESFLKLAQENLSAFQKSAQGELESRKQAVDSLVKPLKESLEKVDQKIQELEVKREGAYSSITTQIAGLMQTQQKLQSETGNLVKALRAPQVRGRWGEVQLRRLIELAGMLEYCDFDEQRSVDTDNGRLRPDVIIHLPNNRIVIIDSKVPDQDYNVAMDAQDEHVRAATLKEHARKVRDHFSKLGSKGYWKQFENSAEFVVMFLPMESFFMAALEHDPELISDAVSQGVIIATPTTLLALLKAVYYGWRHEKLTQSAREIKELGEDLHERVGVFVRYFDKIGSGLKTAEQAYNNAVGALDSRVLVTTRKIKELAAIPGPEILTPELTEIEIRRLKSQDNLPIPELPEAESAENGSPTDRK